MRTIKTFRSSGLSLYQLKMESNNISILAERDTNELQTVGIMPELVAELKLSVLKLDDLSTYGLDLAAKKVITAERNRAKNMLKEFIYILREQLMPVFNNETSLYDSIFSKNIASTNIAAFILAATETLQAIKQNLDLAAEYHFSAAQVSTFEGLLENLKVLEAKKRSVEKAFTSESSNRGDVKEEVFAKLNYIASVGKAYWKYKNPVKSAQYNISRKSKASQSASDDES